MREGQETDQWTGGAETGTIDLETETTEAGLETGSIETDHPTVTVKSLLGMLAEEVCLLSTDLLDLCLQEEGPLPEISHQEAGLLEIGTVSIQGTGATDLCQETGQELETRESIIPPPH